MTISNPSELQIWVDGIQAPAVPGSTRIQIGRVPENDITIDHPLISRRHAVLTWNGGWSIADAGSTNGIYAGGHRVQSVNLRGTQDVRLGGPDAGPVLRIHVVQPAPSPVRSLQKPAGVDDRPHMQALRQNMSAVYQTAGNQPPPQRQAVDIASGSAVRIGRTPDNHVVVSDVLASRHHAQMISSPAGLVIEDLRSVNGTYVNGRRITRQSLTDGDVVTIGNSDFVVSEGRLVRGQAKSVVSGGVHVSSVSLTIDGKQLLDDIDFTAAPGTLTAIIGPSGAGKSTVSKIVSGSHHPSVGTVTFEGHGVHAEYEALRTRIGMVPQDDVLHSRLTLRQALRYAAQLRLPPDMSKSDRDLVIDGVLAELQLSEHTGTRIDKLSGGQRKRASVAMELLTGPALLILDEPTSGLDPALDRQVMQTLRRLADAGRVVIVVTHSVAHLAMCDQVLLLAPGGKTAFCGPPGSVESAMGTSDWPEIFAYVAAAPQEASNRYRATVRRRPPPAPPQPGSGRPRPRQASSFRQVSTIARRQFRLILADRGYLAFLLLLPVVLGALTLVIPGSAGFGLNAPGTTETLQILVILVIGATFMGSALTVRDLVGERSIFERERAVGLRPGAYLAAKVIVFALFAIMQSVVMLLICYAGRGTPGKGVYLPATVELGIDLALLTCLGALIGLAISASVRTPEQTMPPLVVVVMIQLVFCGGLFALHGRGGLEQIAWLIPSRWGYAAAASTVEVQWTTPGSATEDEPLWKHDIATLGISYAILGAMALVLVLFIYSRLRLKRS
jgi:ABC transport system ATP-binding/permease protein